MRNMILEKIKNGLNHHYWPKNTAGRTMISKDFVPVVEYQKIIRDITLEIKEKIQEWETLNYLYVIDESGKLIGIASIKEIFRQSPEIKISQVMKKKIISVQPELDQEKVAYLALKNNIKAIPVVDKDNHLLGIVSSDRILSILNKEATEDIYHMAGIFRPEFRIGNILEIPVFKSLKSRIPWLLVGLVGGIIAAWIIGFFEAYLKENLILALFIPIIIYMANAVGMQTQTLFIRDLTIQHDILFKKYFLRQLIICFLISIVLSLGFFLIVLFGWASAYLGLVLAISMLVTIIAAVFFLPYSFLFYYINLNPIQPLVAVHLRLLFKIF